MKKPFQTHYLEYDFYKLLRGKVSNLSKFIILDTLMPVYALK
ncbi:hypothetical protein HMPREF9394_1651 [Streptococcus sanguinis SK1057]|nr:hypothetical protein HMPREF9394_1651 [Streptococcus sanguinis SK1057]